MAKYVEIATLLKQRLANGEYVSGKLPPLRKLAEDMGVSYLTARQAVKFLGETGCGDNDCGGGQRPRVALITAYWNFGVWQLAIRDETVALGGQVRIIAYGSNTDPIITDALSGDFDLFFLVLPGGDNARLLERLAKLGKKAVVLFEDMSEYGIRSLIGSDVGSATRLLERLRDSGHRSIDVISLRSATRQPFSTRIDVWRRFLRENQLSGVCHEGELRDFSRDDETAYLFCRKELRRETAADAYYCMTPQIAFGFYRACYELGVTVGRDISVFSFGDPVFARLMTPPLATVGEADVAGEVRRIVAEYRPGAELSDQLCFQAKEMKLFEGESLIDHKGMGRKIAF